MVLSDNIRTWQEIEWSPVCRIFLMYEYFTASLFWHYKEQIQYRIFDLASDHLDDWPVARLCNHLIETNSLAG